MEGIKTGVSNGLLYCGIDWAETHHDVAVVDAEGNQLVKRRISDDVSGFTELRLLLERVIGQHGGGAPVMAVDEPVDIVGSVEIAIETDRGLLVAALRAAGFRVWAINPKAVDRYRDRYASSRAKSDPGDALVLANILRTDAHAHRVLPEDTDLAGAVCVLARIHADLIRRRLAEANAIRSLLREYFPAALAAFGDLTSKTSVLVLTTAPTPAAAAALSTEELVGLLRQARRGTFPVQAARLHAIFAAPALRQPRAVEDAMGMALRGLLVAYRATMDAVREVETALSEHVQVHPDVAILGALPGLGPVLTGRLIAEFGDDPARFPDAAARRAYAGTAPVTRASGKKRAVVLRRGGNRRLTSTCRMWAFTAMNASPGARAHYDRRRSVGDGHEAALRNLANKLVGQLDHCLRHHLSYVEHDAWPSLPPVSTHIDAVAVAALAGSGGASRDVTESLTAT